MAPLVSVNIAVKDRRALLAECLDGLRAQSFRDFEVVVVDNGSTDGTRELLDTVELGVPLRVVDHGGSLGAVRNAGVAASRGEIVAFVDSDCVPTETWLAEGASRFVDPALTTVQGRTLPDPRLEKGRWFATQEITGFSQRYEACNLFYRRAALVEAGGFDEAIGFFGEDSMAGWAVRRQGGTELFAADAVVHHTVTHPGLRWHLRRCLKYGNWNTLVRRFPEIRGLFWHRWFLRYESAQTLLAMVATVLGLAALAIGEWLSAGFTFLLVLPFLWRHRPYTWRNRTAIVDALGGVAFDVAIEVGLLWGSIRERTIVL